jgi:hypothetical protein
MAELEIDTAATSNPVATRILEGFMQILHLGEIRSGGADQK